MVEEHCPNCHQLVEADPQGRCPLCRAQLPRFHTYTTILLDAGKPRPRKVHPDPTKRKEAQFATQFAVQLSAWFEEKLPTDEGVLPSDYTFPEDAVLFHEQMSREHGPKRVAVLGHAGVGKTTLLTLLAGGKPPSTFPLHIDIPVPIEGTSFGGYRIVAFEPGYRDHLILPSILSWGHLILVITDSTLENVLNSKDILDLIRRNEIAADVLVIANKQDVPKTLSPEFVQQILGVRTYGMVATDPVNRQKALDIVKEALTMGVPKAAPPPALPLATQEAAPSAQGFREAPPPQRAPPPLGQPQVLQPALNHGSRDEAGIESGKLTKQPQALPSRKEEQRIARRRTSSAEYLLTSLREVLDVLLLNLLVGNAIIIAADDQTIGQVSRALNRILSFSVLKATGITDIKTAESVLESRKDRSLKRSTLIQVTDQLYQRLTTPGHLKHHVFINLKSDAPVCHAPPRQPDLGIVKRALASGGDCATQARLVDLQLQLLREQLANLVRLRRTEPNLSPEQQRAALHLDSERFRLLSYLASESGLETMLKAEEALAAEQKLKSSTSPDSGLAATPLQRIPPPLEPPEGILREPDYEERNGRWVERKKRAR